MPSLFRLALSSRLRSAVIEDGGGGGVQGRNTRPFKREPAWMKGYLLGDVSKAGFALARRGKEVISLVPTGGRWCFFISLTLPAVVVL